MKNRFAAPITAVILLLTVLGFTVSAARSPQPSRVPAIAKAVVLSGPQAVPDVQPIQAKSPEKPPVQEQVKKQDAAETKTAAKTTANSKTAAKSKTTRVALNTPAKTKKQPTSRGVSSPPGISRVISIALSMKGVPYRHGGSSPKGFDCSGFTSYAYKNGAGITLPRTSGGQSDIGVAVSKGDLVPGDIVYFNTNGRGVSHVGIYIGGNNFVHASSSKGITVTSLSDSYYKPRYLGARRVK